MHGSDRVLFSLIEQEKYKKAFSTFTKTTQRTTADQTDLTTVLLRWFSADDKQKLSLYSETLVFAKKSKTNSFLELVLLHKFYLTNLEFDSLVPICEQLVTHPDTAQHQQKAALSQLFLTTDFFRVRNAALLLRERTENRFFRTVGVLALFLDKQFETCLAEAKQLETEAFCKKTFTKVRVGNKNYRTRLSELGCFVDLLRFQLRCIAELPTERRKHELACFVDTHDFLFGLEKLFVEDLLGLLVELGANKHPVLKKVFNVRSLSRLDNPSHKILGQTESFSDVCYRRRQPTREEKIALAREVATKDKSDRRPHYKLAKYALEADDSFSVVSAHFCHFESDTDELVSKVHLYQNVTFLSYLAWHHFRKTDTVLALQSLAAYFVTLKQQVKTAAEFFAFAVTQNLPCRAVELVAKQKNLFNNETAVSFLRLTRVLWQTADEFGRWAEDFAANRTRWSCLAYLDKVDVGARKLHTPFCFNVDKEVCQALSGLENFKSFLNKVVCFLTMDKENVGFLLLREKIFFLAEQGDKLAAFKELRNLLFRSQHLFTFSKGRNTLETNLQELKETFVETCLDPKDSVDRLIIEKLSI